MAVRGEWIGRHPWARKASGADRCSRHGPETGGWADLHHGNGHRRPGGAAAGLLHQRGRARPTGKGDHQHRGAERGGGVGLGFHQGQLQQKAIADRTGSAAMATPISGEGLYPPAELLGGTADGAISAMGTAMEQQMDRPATAALKPGGGDALLRPDEITATSGDDDDRAMGQPRRRQEAKGRQCSGLGHCSRGQVHGLQSKRTGRIVRGLRYRRRWARGPWCNLHSTSANELQDWQGRCGAIDLRKAKPSAGGPEDR